MHAMRRMLLEILDALDETLLAIDLCHNPMIVAVVLAAAGISRREF